MSWPRRRRGRERRGPKRDDDGKDEDEAEAGLEVVVEVRNAKMH